MEHCSYCFNEENPNITTATFEVIFKFIGEKERKESICLEHAVSLVLGYGLHGSSNYESITFSKLKEIPKNEPHKSEYTKGETSWSYQ